MRQHHDAAGHLLRLALAAAWVLGAGYVWSVLDLGWYAHDEGTLAQPALRLLQGELPHRDFHHVYTGGLAFLNAAALTLFGVDLVHLRWPLFLLFVCAFPAYYMAARNLAGRWLALAASLCFVALTLPNYPAAIPSWYNLFLAIFAVTLAPHAFKSRRPLPLLALGAICGLSVLAKITGLYLLAGLLVGLGLFEQEDAYANSKKGETTTPGLAAAYLILSCALILLVARTVAEPGDPAYLYHYILPVLAPLYALVAREWGLRHSSWVPRVKSLTRTVGLMAAGFLLAVLPFVLLYAVAGGLDELMGGLFVSPQARLDFAAHPPPPPWHVVLTIPLVGLAALAALVDEKARTVLLGATGVAAVLLLMAARWEDGFAYQTTWDAIRALPVVCLWIVAVRLAAKRHSLNGATCVVLGVGALSVLMQFPFAAGIYFLYISPLLLLVVLAASQAGTRHARPMMALGLVTLTAFMLLYVNRSPPDIGYRPSGTREWSRLDLDNASLRVESSHKQVYDALIPFVREQAGNGVLLAGPDAPEIYALTGLRNHSGILYEFFEADGALGVWRDLGQQADVAVLKRSPPFSPPVAGDLYALLQAELPQSREFGGFEVRWR